MEKWKGKVAVVTGASSGIGEEISRQLVENGMIVVGFARRESKLKALQEELDGKPGRFYFVPVDLSSEENILEAFNWVKNTLKSVDVLVNNAGVLNMCDLLADTQKWKQMFDVNVIGLNICSREVIKIMQETKAKEGHIININSVAGHFHMAIMKDLTVYSATKLSAVAITESLREYLGTQNLPIRVTSISPGLVDTEMAEYFKATGDLKSLKSMDVADAVLYALAAPQRVNIAEIIIRATGENSAAFLHKTQTISHT